MLTRTGLQEADRKVDAATRVDKAASMELMRWVKASSRQETMEIASWQLYLLALFCKKTASACSRENKPKKNCTNAGKFQHKHSSMTQRNKTEKQQQQGFIQHASILVTPNTDNTRWVFTRTCIEKKIRTLGMEGLHSEN